MKKETKKKKKVEKKKISKKKTVKTVIKDGDLYIAKEDVNAGEPVATETAPAIDANGVEYKPCTDCEAPAVEHFSNVVLKSNHMRQAEINNRVSLVMSFNPQIARNSIGEWSCCIGYDNEVGLFTTGKSALEAVLIMFTKLS